MPEPLPLLAMGLAQHSEKFHLYNIVIISRLLIFKLVCCCRVANDGQGRNSSSSAKHVSVDSTVLADIRRFGRKHK